MTEEEARQKITDPYWRINHLYKIKTKDRKLKTLKLNPTQADYWKNQSKKDIILKARQLGFSTLKLIDKLDYTLTNKNTNTAIIAHEKKKVQSLFEIVRLAYDNMPEELKPKASYDNRNELYFPRLNSKIYVALDTRGETVHNLHVSELAFIDGAEEKMTGILESVPRDGIITFESTANGMSGYFYDVWEDKYSEFKKHFYNWIWDPEYSLLTGKTMNELYDEYIPLATQYNLIPDIATRYKLTPQQFNWYIQKVRRLKELVAQEYPTNELEAFVASGRNIFNITDLQKHEPKDPISKKYGNMLVWEEPLQGFNYTIGCDSSEGVGRDNAVISVLNAYTGEQVAEFATNNVPPDVLGGYLIDIGNYYNKALINLEINNHGLAVLNRMKDKYYNIYRREVFDKHSRQNTYSLGWKTTQVTKPLLVDQLEEAVRDETIRVNSGECLKEMKTFVRTDEQGRHGFGAEGSNKDDRVIAIGLALQAIKYLPRQKAPESIAQKKLREYIEKKNLSEYFPNKPEIVTRQSKPSYRIRK